MSRIGNMTIDLPPGVTLEIMAGKAVIKGAKGMLELPIDPAIKVTVAGSILTVVNNRGDEAKNLHGLTRALLGNAVVGVTKGWDKTVELVGVGYRAQGGGSEVTLIVGYTHPVKITAPKDVTFTISDNTKIKIDGPDKKIVGEIAAQIRSVKPPEPYKGKGIRYLGEVVRKKAGKAVKAAGAPA